MLKFSCIIICFCLSKAKLSFTYAIPFLRELAKQVQKSDIARMSPHHESVEKTHPRSDMLALLPSITAEISFCDMA